MKLIKNSIFEFSAKSFLYEVIIIKTPCAKFKLIFKISFIVALFDFLKTTPMQTVLDPKSTILEFLAEIFVMAIITWNV